MHDLLSRNVISLGDLSEGPDHTCILDARGQLGRDMFCLMLGKNLPEHPRICFREYRSGILDELETVAPWSTASIAR